MGDPAVCSRPHPPPLACFFLSVCLNFYTCTCTCIMAYAVCCCCCWRTRSHTPGGVVSGYALRAVACCTMRWYLWLWLWLYTRP